MPHTFIFFEADLWISQFSPYRVISITRLPVVHPKKTNQKKGHKLSKGLDSSFVIEWNRSLDCFAPLHSFKGIFATQNRNINSKLAPRFRQFLTNLYYYAVEKDLTYLFNRP